MMRARLKMALGRFGVLITGPLDARLTAVAAGLDELRHAVDRIPASEASVASATEAAMVLSRAAQVVESQLYALTPPAAGEAMMTAAESDADRLDEALAGWTVIARCTIGSVVVVRARLP